jgi:hypothetical protein
MLAAGRQCNLHKRLLAIAYQQLHLRQRSPLARHQRGYGRRLRDGGRQLRLREAVSIRYQADNDLKRIIVDATLRRERQLK